MAHTMASSLVLGDIDRNILLESNEEHLSNEKVQLSFTLDNKNP